MPLRAFISFPRAVDVRPDRGVRGRVSMPLRAFISFPPPTANSSSCWASCRFNALAGIYFISTRKKKTPLVTSTSLVFQCPCGHLFHFHDVWHRKKCDANSLFQCPCGHLFHFHEMDGEPFTGTPPTVSMPLRAFISFPHQMTMTWQSATETVVFQCPCGHLFHFHDEIGTAVEQQSFPVFQCPCGHLFHFHDEIGTAVEQQSFPVFQCPCGHLFHFHENNHE